MIAVPAFLALGGSRRPAAIVAVALLYFLMIGFRFQVGMDWDNYVVIYSTAKLKSFTDVIWQREPGFKLLMWLGANVGGGLILVNVISALVFCVGFFKVTKKCEDPFIAIVAGTPLLVVAFAMSGTRQAIAMGVIFYLFATWEQRTTTTRVLLVILASLFHFSSIFVLIFVALASNMPSAGRVIMAAIIAAAIGLIIYYAPTSMSAYSELYVAGPRKLTAPGAIVQVGVLSVAAILYVVSAKDWRAAGLNPALQSNLAVATLVALASIPLSSVGAYRFALYLWPMAMSVWGGLPGQIDSGVGRAFYRLAVVVIFVLLLWAWLSFANNAYGWLPYHNWLLTPEGIPLRRDMSPRSF